MFRQAAQSVKRTVVRTALVTVSAAGALEVTTHLPTQGRSSEFYHTVANEWVTPFMRRFLDPEVAHNVAIAMAQRGLSPRHHPSAAEQRVNVQTTLWGQTFQNPVGLAAGFDKHGECMGAMLELGFGSVEIGTVTPQPQPGNLQRPRLFRLPADLALINRYGFNSVGAAAVQGHLQAFRTLQQEQKEKAGRQSWWWWESWWPGSKVSAAAAAAIATGRVGVNIGKNADTANLQDVIADYVGSIQTLGPFADYIVINISSPNTVGLRDWQQETATLLRPLLQACLQARDELVVAAVPNGTNPKETQQQPPFVPLLVKLAPDLTDDQLKDIAKTCLELHVDGLVVTNTTNQIQPDDLISYQHKHESGGLSGAPVKDKSTACIGKLYAYTAGQIPIIGVGGIGSGRDAYEKFCAGASLVQVYSMMVYKGPGLVSQIRHELAQIMLQNGQRSLQHDVVGMDHEDLAWRARQERLRQREVQIRNSSMMADADATDADAVVVGGNDEKETNDNIDADDDAEEENNNNNRRENGPTAEAAAAVASA